MKNNELLGMDTHFFRTCDETWISVSPTIKIYLSKGPFFACDNTFYLHILQ